MGRLGLRLTLIVICMVVAASQASAVDCDRTSTGFLPLTDLGAGLYLDMFQGGLYPGGSNEPPESHAAIGLNAASGVMRLNTNGQPDPDGAYVLLSIGMSNASREFSRFEVAAERSDEVSKDGLVIINGAQGGETAPSWESPDAPTYDFVRDERLAPEGLSEAQVQAVWVKNAIGGPDVSLPDENADAYRVKAALGNIVRAVLVRYPNVKLVFLSSRIYAGYADTTLNPEPYAYETGFAVKWLIEAQIRQTNGEGIDPGAGDLAIGTAAPWLAWGPYLWADGLIPRGSDGLTWECSDFENDGTHPVEMGGAKVVQLLFDFFLNSPFAAPWFRAVSCPHDGDVDGNAVVTPNDALLAFRHYLMDITLDSCARDEANVDGEADVTPQDALQIFQKYLSGQ